MHINILSPYIHALGVKFRALHWHVTFWVNDTHDSDYGEAGGSTDDSRMHLQLLVAARPAWEPPSVPQVAASSGMSEAPGGPVVRESASRSLQP